MRSGRNMCHVFFFIEYPPLWHVCVDGRSIDSLGTSKAGFAATKDLDAKVRTARLSAFFISIFKFIVFTLELCLKLPFGDDFGFVVVAVLLLLLPPYIFE